MAEAMTKREACAKAAYDAWGDEQPWNDLDDIEKSYFFVAYDAILAELRVPSEAMVVAGCNHENMGDMAGRWQAMIDAVGK